MRFFVYKFSITATKTGVDVQLYAYSLNGQVVSAADAKRYTDYNCLECGQTVRMRGGLKRKAHFFHLQPPSTCRQHAKSMTHLQAQLALLKCLPPGAAELEARFDKIDRIADVAWHAEKIVFEVQCSAISAQEVAARNRDYGSTGYDVVWFLHDRRFGRFRPSEAEIFLENSPHYYTNMDDKGAGYFYDAGRGGQDRFGPLMIDPGRPYRRFQKGKRCNWSLGFIGDASEKGIVLAKQLKSRSIFKLLKERYCRLFHYFLEKSCR